jgi:hypothetical protein
MPSVYTIRLWYNYTARFFPYDKFQVCWGLYNLLLLLATLPTLASVYTLGGRGMYVLCLPFFFMFVGMCKILKY